MGDGRRPVHRAVGGVASSQPEAGHERPRMTAHAGGPEGSNGVYTTSGGGVALAVRPARGVSKQVPRKNLRLLGGKPLIQWSIESARASTELDRCIVSTDDEEIADIARTLGADVPFIRPAEYAQDNT